MGQIFSCSSLARMNASISFRIQDLVFDFGRFATMDRLERPVRQPRIGGRRGRGMAGQFAPPSIQVLSVATSASVSRCAFVFGGMTVSPLPLTYSINSESSAWPGLMTAPFSPPLSAAAATSSRSSPFCVSWSVALDSSVRPEFFERRRQLPRIAPAQRRRQPLAERQARPHKS